MQWVDGAALGRAVRGHACSTCTGRRSSSTRLGLGGVRDYAGPHPEVTQALERELRRASTHARRAPGARAHRADDRQHRRSHRRAGRGRAGRPDRGRHARARTAAARASAARCRTRCCTARAPRSCACRRRAARSSRAPTPLLERARAHRLLAARQRGGARSRTRSSRAAARVHLVHVTADRAGTMSSRRTTSFRTPARAARQAAAQVEHASSAELVPVEAIGRVVTQLHVLESDRVADAICQAAERLDAGVICLGTHGAAGCPAACSDRSPPRSCAARSVPCCSRANPLHEEEHVMAKALIVYGTTEGQTAKIAQHIADAGARSATPSTSCTRPRSRRMPRSMHTPRC